LLEADFEEIPYSQYEISYLIRPLYKSASLSLIAAPLNMLPRSLILQLEEYYREFLFLSTILTKSTGGEISVVFLNMKPALILRQKSAWNTLIDLLFLLHCLRYVEASLQYSLLSAGIGKEIIRSLVYISFSSKTAGVLAFKNDLFYSLISATRSAASRVISTKLKSKTSILENLLSCENSPIFLSSEIIFPIIPGSAVYSIPLKCEFEPEISIFTAAETVASFDAEFEASFIQLLESLMKIIPDFRRSLYFNFPVFLKNQIFIPINFIFTENLFSGFLTEAYIPGLYILSGEAFLQTLFDYNLIFRSAYMGPLLIKVISEIKALTPFIYSALVSLKTEASSRFHVFVSKELPINCFPLLGLSTIIAQNLIFKILFEQVSLHSLIGNILLSLKPAPAFSFGYDFSTILLACFTSSLPIYIPPIPFGGLFFANLSRIYNYRISDLRRL